MKKQLISSANRAYSWRNTLFQTKNKIGKYSVDTFQCFTEFNCGRMNQIEYSGGSIEVAKRDMLLPIDIPHVSVVSILNHHFSTKRYPQDGCHVCSQWNKHTSCDNFGGVFGVVQLQTGRVFAPQTKQQSK